jgi:hypothetical protein
MNSVRIKAFTAAPIACIVFFVPVICILLPIIIHLQGPEVLEHLDSFAASFSSFSASTVDTTSSRSSSSSSSSSSSASTSASTGGATSPTTSTMDPLAVDSEIVSVGQVFTHRRIRYQGVITSILTAEEKKKYRLSSKDTWYNALVDIRYKPGGISDHVKEQDINLIYPAESNIKHPKLWDYFETFNPNTFSYIVKKRKGRKSTTTTAGQKKRNTMKKKKKRKETRI